MPGSTPIDAEAAVALLAEGTGEPYRLVRRLAGGETGAHQVIGPEARMLVLKWDAAPHSQELRGEAVVLAERLRLQAGWPVPRQAVVDTLGVRFVLQEFMPGRPVDRLSHQIVGRLLDYHARRIDLARVDDPVRWPSALIRTLTEGGENYCLHSSLRDYDRRTRSLVSRIEAFAGAVHLSELTGRDIVHWDLHPGNLLADDGGLTAIVDTDFVLIGDARFDLVTLALTSLTARCEPGVRSRLSAVAFEGLDQLRQQTYLAHLFIRLLDWSIRGRRSEEVDFWLARADEMLSV